MPGNHERNSPLLGRMFATPGGQTNWAYRAGPATFVGINGDDDWEPWSARALWLESVLSEAATPYVFVMDHYPPWTCSYHGKLVDGVPYETTVRQSKETIMPLLEKYRVTAFLAGHTHAYERSEKPGGVTVIVSGGAGAPMHSGSKETQEQNPYMVVYSNILHYCEFDVSSEACTMNVLDLDGNVIDSRKWSPRL